MLTKIRLTVICCAAALEIIAQQPKIRVQQNAFMDEKGDCFVPFGYNYVGAKFDALLEDNWLTDSAWAVIVSDLQELKTYNGNTARIHLQYNRFMDAVDSPNQAAFNRLSQLVAVAENEHLYLMVTGLCAYRAADQPLWYDTLSESNRWATQALFWEKVAETIGGSKAVWAYDLINEPVVADTGTWLPGAPLGDFHFVQNLTRTPNGRSFDEIVDAWSLQMTHAIRAKDTLTPITIGFIGCGPVKLLSKHLDFISAHVYPQPDSAAGGFCSMRLSDAINFVQENQDNKPFVLSEIAPLFSFEATEVFMDSTCPMVNGWINHYGGIKIEEYSDTNIVDILQRYNLLIFKAKYADLHQCQSPCGMTPACVEGSEPDPDLVASFTFSGDWLEESGSGQIMIANNCNPGENQAGESASALEFDANLQSSIITLDTAQLQFRHDRSFTLLARLYPRFGIFQSLWAYDDKDNLDADSPNTRDVVRLELNNTGLFDGQVAGDSVFYFVLVYGRDNSSFLTPIERLTSKCYTFDQWYDLAAVYDTGKDSTFLYINGHLQAATRHQLTVPWANSGQFPMVGRNNAFAPLLPGYFNGKIDYLKVYDRALGAEEITACRSAENDTVCTVPVSATATVPRQSVKVWPNPATDQLWINLPPCSFPAQLTIKEFTGKDALAIKIPGFMPALPVDVGALPAGYYQVCLTDAVGAQFVVGIMLL